MTDAYLLDNNNIIQRYMKIQSQTPKKTENNSQPYLNTHNHNFDRQSVVEGYNILRSDHSDLLSRINLSPHLKREIFGFTQSKYCVNKAENLNLITVNDFFKGKLTMKEDAYQKSKYQKNIQGDKNSFKREDKEFGQLDIELRNFQQSPQRSTQRNTRQMGDDSEMGDRDLLDILGKIGNSKEIPSSIHQKKVKENPKIKPPEELTQSIDICYSQSSQKCFQ